MTEEFSYFKEHLPELEKKYGGEVIAIYDKKVIAHGRNMEKVYEDARKIAGDEHLFVTVIPEEKEHLTMPALRDYIPAKDDRLEETISLRKKTGFKDESKYKKILLPPSTGEIDLEFRKWEEELSFFNSVKNKLFENIDYKNKFIAIKDKKVVDSDLDNFRLVKRINKKYPDEVVLIIKVEMGVPVAEIPSPEVSP